MDFFHLPERYNGTFDWMLEQTFFCAINPKRRSDYVEIASRVLKRRGMLAALFYETGEEDGPPFNTSPEQVRKFFEPNFTIQHLEKTQHSIERRRGKEWLGLLVNK